MEKQTDLYRKKPEGLSLYLRVFFSVIVLLSIWHMVSVVLYAVTVQSSGDPGSFPPVYEFIKKQTFNFISNLFVGSIYIILIEIPRKRIRLSWWHLPLLFVICLPGAFAINLMSTILRSYGSFEFDQIDSLFVLRSISSYPTLIVVIIGYGLTLLWYMAKVEKENSLIAESLASEARWQMLRYQVNPHFLFNSLNSIMALINNDKDKARFVVNELSSYFRYTLSWNDSSVISLSEEMKAVKHFLEIQKIRFEEKLSYNFDIDDDLNDFRIPIFGLQVLVENAVKYGLKTHPGMVNIFISAKKDEGYNVISVSNTGKMYIKPDDGKERNSKGPGGTNSGIANLKGRLEILYPGISYFEIKERGDNVVAEIRVACLNNNLK